MVVKKEERKKEISKFKLIGDNRLWFQLFWWQKRQLLVKTETCALYWHILVCKCLPNYGVCSVDGLGQQLWLQLLHLNASWQLWMWVLHKLHCSYCTFLAFLQSMFIFSFLQQCPSLLRCLDFIILVIWGFHSSFTPKCCFSKFGFPPSSTHWILK